MIICQNDVFWPVLPKISSHFVRIFPTLHIFSIADTFLNGACLMEMIPRSFWYPSDVNQITHVLNYENLLKAEVKSDPLSLASGK